MSLVARAFQRRQKPKRPIIHSTFVPKPELLALARPVPVSVDLKFTRENILERLADQRAAARDDVRRGVALARRVLIDFHHEVLARPAPAPLAAPIEEEIEPKSTGNNSGNGKKKGGKEKKTKKERRQAMESFFKKEEVVEPPKGLDAKEIFKRCQVLAKQDAEGGEGTQEGEAGGDGEGVKSLTFLKSRILPILRQTREVKSTKTKVDSKFLLSWRDTSTFPPPRAPVPSVKDVEKARRAVEVGMRMETAHLNRRRQRKRLGEMRVERGVEGRLRKGEKVGLKA